MGGGVLLELNTGLFNRSLFCVQIYSLAISSQNRGVPQACGSTTPKRVFNLKVRIPAGQKIY